MSQTTKARQAADQLVRDLEAARSRALATRSLTRVAISAMSSSYTGYLDSDRDGVLAESVAETSALVVVPLAGRSTPMCGSLGAPRRTCRAIPAPAA